jgi:hypothetical protein
LLITPWAIGGEERKGHNDVNRKSFIKKHFYTVLNYGLPNQDPLFMSILVCAVQYYSKYLSPWFRP